MIRRAGSRDVAGLAELYAALLAHHATLDPAFALAGGAVERLPALLAELVRDADAAVFVREESGGIEGFCAVRVDRAAGLLEEGSRAEITELVVRPQRRREGVGRSLVAAACDWAGARGARRVEVRVAARNDEGQAFWRALGYAGFVDVLHRRL